MEIKTKKPRPQNNIKSKKKMSKTNHKMLKTLNKLIKTINF